MSAVRPRYCDLQTQYGELAAQELFAARMMINSVHARRRVFDRIACFMQRHRGDVVLLA